MAQYDPGSPPGAPPRRRPPAPSAPYNPYPNGPYRVTEPGEPTTYYPGGVGSGSTGIPQGHPSADTPAPAPAPAPAPPPPPPKTDWSTYLKNDPGYASTIANLQAQEAGLLTQYGGVPSGVQLIGANGQPVGSDVSTAAAGNPNSTLSILKRQLSGDISGIQNNAVSHGLLYSGVNAQNQQNEYSADQQRQYGALSALQNALLGLGGQQTQAYNNAYSNWWNYFNSGVPSGA